MEDPENIVKEYNKTHNRKIQSPIINTEEFIFDNEQSVNNMKAESLTSMSSISSLRIPELIYQGYLYKFESRFDFTMAWCSLDQNYLTINSKVDDMHTQMGIKVAEISKVTPYVEQWEGKTVYKFALTQTNPMNVMQRSMSFKFCHETYLDMRLDEPEPNASKYIQIEGQGHQQEKKNDTDKKIDEMFACVDDKPFSHNDDLDNAERRNSQDDHKECDETDIIPLIKNPISFASAGHSNLQNLFSEELQENDKCWVLGTEDYAEYETWLSSIKANIIPEEQNIGQPQPQIA